MLTKLTKLAVLAGFLFILSSWVFPFAPDDSGVAARLDEIRQLRTEDPTRAIRTIDDLLTTNKLTGEESGWLHYERALALKQGLNEKEEALLSFYKALTRFRESDDAVKGQHRALRQLGHTYNELNHHGYALEYYQEIHSLDLENKNDQLYNQFNIAYTYRLIGEFDTAIAIQNKLVTVFGEHGMLTDLMDSHLEMGICYIGLENWEMAKEHYNTVDDLLLNFQGDPNEYKAKVLGSLGYIFMKEGDYSKAEEFLLQALPLMEAENDLQMLSIHYNDLGLLEIAKGNQDKALDYFRKNITLDPEKSDVSQIKDALNHLISVYKEKGETDLALDYSQRLNEIAVPFIELAKKLETLHDRYKAERVKHLTDKYELQDQLLKAINQYTAVGILLAGVVLTSLFVFIWFRKRQRVDDEVIQFFKLKHRQLILLCQKFKLDVNDLDKLL